MSSWSAERRRLVDLHTAAIVAQTVSGAHPRAARGEQHVIQSPSFGPWGEVGLNPTEPSSGGTKGNIAKLHGKVTLGVRGPENTPLLSTIGYKTHVLSSTGKVDSDPPPVFVLGRGVDGTLRITSAADGGRHTLRGDERPVMTAVCGVLQSHTVGERGGLTAAHTQLKLEE